MTAQTFSFSDRALAALPRTKTGQYIVRDLDLKGFFVMVGARKKTYMVQAEFWRDGKRRCRRVALGPVEDLVVREARIAAKSMIAKIISGELHREEAEAEAKAALEAAEALATTVAAQTVAARGVTLREAWDRYRVSHLERKARSELTIRGYNDHVERLFADWLDLPLSHLGDNPALVADRHDAMTQENGPALANGAMRTLRAIYNHARKRHRNLPPDNPTLAVDWNVVKRRDTAMGLEDLPAWFEQARRLRHPIRREFHLFTLLSGSRPTAILQAKVEHLNLRERILHIPRPKGGADKAFDIPLSRAMIRCLVRAMRASRMLVPEQAQTWIFAGESQEGHMTAHREQRQTLSKWGNDLRQTFRTVGQAAGLSEIDMHLLMNHSLPGVNAGYITRAKLLGGHLRKTQEDLSSLIMDQAGVTGVRWPELPSRRIGDPRVDPTPPDPRTRAYVRSNPLTVEGKPRRRVGRPPGSGAGVRRTPAAAASIAHSAG